jgi:hypothetical protein
LASRTSPAGAVHHHDEAQHTLGQNLPHEVEAALPRCAEQVQHQVLIDRNPAEIHGDRGGFLDAFRLGRDLAFRGDHVDLADRTDEFRFARIEGTCNNHFDRLHNCDLK